MEIRKMQPNELEEIIQLWRATSQVTYTFLAQVHTEEEDRAYFTNQVAAHFELWVAEDATNIVGFLALKGSYIDRLYIHPDHQRRGIGKRLIVHAQKLSPHGLELHTHQKNLQACAFYEKEGFRAVRYGVSPPPESEPDVEYHWRPAERDCGQWTVANG